MKAAAVRTINDTAQKIDTLIFDLHAFIKKSQQTPERELKLARKRLKELQNG